MQKTNSQKFIDFITENEDYRNRLFDTIVHAMNRTPPILDCMENRSQKDNVVKYHLEDNGLGIMAVDSKSYDAFHLATRARISIKIQKQIFPRPSQRGGGMTAMRGIMLKNKFSEKEGAYVDLAEDSVVMAIQPADSSVEQPFVVGLLAASNIQETMLKITGHNVNLNCPSDDWDLKIINDTPPLPLSAKTLNDIWRKHHLAAMKELLSLEDQNNEKV